MKRGPEVEDVGPAGRRAASPPGGLFDPARPVAYSEHGSTTPGFPGPVEDFAPQLSRDLGRAAEQAGRDLRRRMEGEALRDAGLDRVASGPARETWLAQARAKAFSLARSAPSLAITAEDLRPFLPPAPHPNLWGAIFRGEEWECVGFVPSKHPDAHARAVRSWRLRP